MVLQLVGVLQHEGKAFLRGPASIPRWRAAPCRQDALRRAITTRRGSCSWTVDHAGWVVTLRSPEEQDVSGKTIKEGLAWCLVWLMAKGTSGDWGHELGVGPFRA